jgi:hypothetical protein
MQRRVVVQTVGTKSPIPAISFSSFAQDGVDEAANLSVHLLAFRRSRKIAMPARLGDMQLGRNVGRTQARCIRAVLDG